ncbi:hypothetical protein HRI96_10270 [Treponema parvum]|uniref:Uncharacterized protein n=1 Tax=Treponema parvum TaxID=138851 RepID=A0A975F1U7_9SPIR|nr:hypothetical protein [Treponema parvum]QTQ12549.1 hypothetical protein HRI96_10270 [Treponema parvum]
MYSHPIKKIIGLLVLYTAIIIGIFIVQFKSESVFSENIGALRFTFAQTGTQQNPVLKNSLQALFKGLLIYFDDKDPVTVREAGSDSVKNITLISWSKASPLSFALRFTENVSLLFSVTGTGDDAGMTIQADLPRNIESVTLNYKPAGGYNFSRESGAGAYGVKIEAKGNKYVLSASNIGENKISLNKGQSAVTYAVVKDKKTFSFASVGKTAAASSAAYSQNIKKLENNIITLFRDSVQNNSPQPLTEQSVAAYVAVMAKNGQYNAAIDGVPDLFKKGQKRTYVSAPYFNTLERMFATLQMQFDNTSRMVSEAVRTNSCEIFSLPYLSNFVIKNNKLQDVWQLLSVPSAVLSSANGSSAVSASQAAGIIYVYMSLIDKFPALADMLENSIEPCLSIIEQSCSLQTQANGEKLVVSENGIPLKPAGAVNIGSVLLGYGTMTNNRSVIDTGYSLINSSFEDIAATDLYTYSEIYPILVKDNPYYPHFIYLGENDSRTVWAWTCAENITYKKDEDGTFLIDIVFPEGLTHYVIFGGIPDFRKIQIYGMDFRTDPRFETYNSSGYVHLKDTDILLLKSRHRNNLENVSIFYNNPVRIVQPTATERVSAENTEGQNAKPADSFENSEVKANEASY